MATRKNEGAHEALVQWLVTQLHAKGYSNIKADLPGWAQPPKITWTSTGEGHIPDASAHAGGRECIFEVETEDTISIEHTKSQLTLFDAYAKQHSAALVVVVPNGSEGDAQRQLATWGLNATVW
jgi:hypothetical protein